MPKFRLFWSVLLVFAPTLGIPPEPPASPKADSALESYVYTANGDGFNVTSTLIYGKTEAVLIDCQYRAEDAQKLADHIAATKRQLKAIFITHPDADHYTGAAVLLKQFPGTPIYMTQTGLEGFKRAASASVGISAPKALPSVKMTINSQVVEFIEDLQGDYPTRPANTLVWVPSIGVLIGDDLVFSGIHPWLAESTTATRGAWIKSLDRVASFYPRVLIPGHRRRPTPDDSVVVLVS